MQLEIWDRLKIEPTRDKDSLKKAYRTQLVTVHPEDDPEGFVALRAAYEEALRLADLPEEEKTEEEETVTDDSPRGQMLRSMQEIYASFYRRIDVKEWERLLSTPYATSIETAEEAMILLLDFVTEHYVLPHQVFRFLQERYSLDEQREELLERYPFRFLDYVFANAVYADAIDFTLFRGPEDYDYDALLDDITEFSRANKSGDLETQKKLLPKISDLPVENPDIDVLISRYVWQDKRREEAVAAVDRVLEKYPDCVGAMITKGDMLQQLERIDEAEELYRRSAELSGSDRLIRGRLAELMLARKEYEKARDTFFDLLQETPYDGYYRSQILVACEGIISEKQKVLSEDPENMKARVQMAAAYYQSYRFEDAIRLLGEVGPPADPILRAGYYNYYGRSLLSLRRSAEALEKLEQWDEALRSIPEDDTSEDAIAARKRAGYAMTLLGVAHMQLKEYDKARRYIEGALALSHEEYLVTMEEMCTLEYLTGNYEKGIDACRALEKRSPQNFQASNIRAKCSLRMGLLQEAIEYSERAMSVYPYIAEPYYIMAKCLIRMQAYREAEDLAERYLKLNAESDTARLILAKVAVEEKDDMKKAGELLEPVLSHMEDGMSDLEDRAEVYKLLGDVRVSENKAREALEMYDNAMKETDLPDPRINQRKAHILKRLGRYEEALSEYRAQAEHDEDNRAWLNQAFCLMQMGRYEDARQTILYAVKHWPKDIRGLIVSGRMLLDLQFAGDALKVLEKAESELSDDSPEKKEIGDSLVVYKLRALIKLRQYKTAQDILHKLYQEGHITKSIVLEQIELLTCVGQFSAADDTIRKWKWRQDERSEMYDSLCKVRFSAGDLEGLQRLIHEIQGLEIRGEKVATAKQFELLGHLQLLKRKFKEAEQSMLNASNRKPTLRYRYLGYMAECASRQFSGRSRVQRYVASLERTQGTGPELYEARIRLAQGLRAGKKYARAHEILEEIFRTIPWDGELNNTVSEAYEELGWLYLAEKKNGEALLAFQKADDTRGFDASLKDVILRLKNDSRN